MKPGPKTHWTHARIISALLAHNDTHGRPPKLNEWLKATPFTPSVSTVRFQFGTWNHALEAAGLPVRTSRVYWTRERLIAAAQAWNEAHGHPPLADDWRVPTLHSPSYSTVYYHFGAWNTLLDAAGLPQVTKRRWTKDRIAQAMLDHLGRTGSWPVDSDWKVAANGVSRPTRSTVVKIFGSWRAAKRYAGWNGTRRRRDTRTAQKLAPAAVLGGSIEPLENGSPHGRGVPFANRGLAEAPAAPTRRAA